MFDMTMEIGDVAMVTVRVPVAGSSPEKGTAPAAPAILGATRAVIMMSATMTPIVLRCLPAVNRRRFVSLFTLSR